MSQATTCKEPEAALRDPVAGCRTLMVRMGAATGADLMNALAEGRMGALELREVLARCSGCTCKTSCEAWLDDHLDAAPVPAPGFCRNRDTMEDLAGR